MNGLYEWNNPWSKAIFVGNLEDGALMGIFKWREIWRWQDSDISMSITPSSQMPGEARRDSPGVLCRHSRWKWWRTSSHLHPLGRVSIWLAKGSQVRLRHLWATAGPRAQRRSLLKKNNKIRSSYPRKIRITPQWTNKDTNGKCQPHKPGMSLQDAWLNRDFTLAKPRSLRTLAALRRFHPQSIEAVVLAQHLRSELGNVRAILVSYKKVWEFTAGKMRVTTPNLWPSNCFAQAIIRFSGNPMGWFFLVFSVQKAMWYHHRVGPYHPSNWEAGSGRRQTPGRCFPCWKPSLMVKLSADLILTSKFGFQ